MNVSLEFFERAVSRARLGAAPDGLSELHRMVMLWKEKPGKIGLCCGNDVFWVSSSVDFNGDWCFDNGVVVDGERLASIVSRTDMADMELLPDQEKNSRIRFTVGSFTCSLVHSPLVELRTGRVDVEQDRMTGKLERVQLGVVRFREALGAVIPAVSREPERGVLQSALLEFCSGRLWIVATNGRWLAQRQISYNAETPVERRLVKLPLRSAQALMTLLNGVSDGLITVEIGGSWMRVESEMGWVFWSKSEEGVYPNWKQVVPKMDDQFFGEVGVEVFMAALRRAGLMTTEKMSSVRVEAGRTTLRLSAGNEQDGLGRDDVEWTGRKADRVEAGVNPEYMGLALKGFAHHPTVKIGFADSLSPIIVRSVDGLDFAVVMPMRLA